MTSLPPTWRPLSGCGVIEKRVTKALESRDPGIMSRFHDYCLFRRTIEDARSNASLTPAQQVKYARNIQTSRSSSTEADVDVSVMSPGCACVGRRYDPERAAETRVATRGRGDIVPTGRCHPLMSRPLAPSDRRTRVIRANSSVRPTGSGEGRIERLNRERPHVWRFAALGSLPVQRCQTAALPRDAIEMHAAAVLAGVKGARACARRLRRP